MVRKALLRFALLFFPLLIIALFWSNMQLKEQNNTLFMHEKGKLEQKTDLAVEFIKPIVSGVHFWSSFPFDSATDTSYSEKIIRFMEAMPNYDQFRILDTNGIEKLRLERNQEGKIISSTIFQDKSDRYYFIESKKLTANEVYISKLDLNIEHGHLEFPFKPVFRCIAPIYDSEKVKIGVVIINYRAEQFIKMLSEHDKGSLFFITNHYGEFVSAPHDSAEFALQKGVKWSGMSSPVYQQVKALEEQKDTAFLANNEIWITTTIHLEEAYKTFVKSPSHNVQLVGNTSWKLTHYIPSSLLEQRNEPIYRGRMLFGTFAFIVLLVLSLVLANRDATKEKLHKRLNQSHQELKKAQTDLEEKYTDLKKVSEKLQTRNSQLREFNYLISHNIRAPITSISTLTDMYEDAKSMEEVHELNPKLKKITQTLSNLVEDLLQYVRILNADKIATQTLDLKEIIEESAALFIEATDQKTFVINTNLEAWNTITFSSIYLKSIIQNLISNAIKYRSHERDAYILFKTYKEKGVHKLEVVDNGIGIDLSKHGKDIFKLYKRFHKQASGKGMGLFIIKSQLEALNATIEIKSEKGVGTIFTITFNKIDNHE